MCEPGQRVQRLNRAASLLARFKMSSVLAKHPSHPSVCDFSNGARRRAWPSCSAFQVSTLFRRRAEINKQLFSSTNTLLLYLWNDTDIKKWHKLRRKANGGLAQGADPDLVLDSTVAGVEYGGEACRRDRIRRAMALSHPTIHSQMSSRFVYMRASYD